MILSILHLFLLCWYESEKYIKVHYKNVITLIVTLFSSPINIQQSQAILKVFLSDGMLVLEALLKSKREDVTGLLKVLQITTRYLHALCVSTKVSKSPKCHKVVNVPNN